MTNPQKKTVLVTGANGFIGSHLAEELLSVGCEVRCLVRQTSNLRWLKGLDVELTYGSLNDIPSLEKAADSVKWIFHIAGAVKAKRPGDFYSHNTQGTLNLAQAALKASPSIERFVFSSSQAAGGPASCLELPKCETDEPGPVSDYGKSKILAEQELYKLSGKLPVTIIRPPSVYGPRDTEMFMFFQWVDRGLALLPGLRTRFAHLIYVKDLVHGLVQAAESKNTIGKTYFLAEDRAYSFQEVQDIIGRSLSRKPLRVHVPIAFAHLAAILSEAGALVAQKPTQFTRQKVAEMAQRYWTVSAQQAKDDFGFACRYDLEAGIMETARWYRENKWL